MKTDLVPLTLAHAPTPLHRLERISARWKGSVWVKRDDLTGLGLSGNKVRKLEYLLADALSRRADTVITCGAVQSNHCRATALAAARVGLKCVLLLRGDPPDEWDGNLLLAGLAGADVRLVSVEKYYRHLPELLKALAAEVKRGGGEPYVIPEGGSNSVGAWGYVEATRELRRQCDQFGIRPARIVVATGSGGTHAGLWVGTRLEGWDVEVVSTAVCYDADETRRRVGEVIQDIRETRNLRLSLKTHDLNVWDAYLGGGYGVAGDAEFRVIAELADTEGILVDPVYTAKAARAVKMELAAGNLVGDTVLWLTGGVFGLFPYRKALASAVGLKFALHPITI